MCRQILTFNQLGVPPIFFWRPEGCRELKKGWKTLLYNITSRSFVIHLLMKILILHNKSNPNGKPQIKVIIATNLFFLLNEQALNQNILNNN